MEQKETTTVHFVYPHGPRISTPDAIGRKVSERLQERYKVVPYNWDELGAIKPGSDDVLLGHPHPATGPIFRRSVKHSGWKRVIVLSPYTHDSVDCGAFFDPAIKRCDLFLAITGNYWYSSVNRSTFSHWLPKMVHVDLAVDRVDFPPVKTRFNEPGRRRFLYIGNTDWRKNTACPSEIARAMPEAEINWMGSGKPGIPGITPLGFQDFRTEQARQLVAEHDFLLPSAPRTPTPRPYSRRWLGVSSQCVPHKAGTSGIRGSKTYP